MKKGILIASLTIIGIIAILGIIDFIYYSNSGGGSTEIHTISIHTESKQFTDYICIRVNELTDENISEEFDNNTFSLLFTFKDIANISHPLIYSKENNLLFLDTEHIGGLFLSINKSQTYHFEIKLITNSSNPIFMEISEKSIITGRIKVWNKDSSDHFKAYIDDEDLNNEYNKFGSFRYYGLTIYISYSGLCVDYFPSHIIPI